MTLSDVVDVLVDVEVEELVEVLVEDDVDVDVVVDVAVVVDVDVEVTVAMGTLKIRTFFKHVECASQSTDFEISTAWISHSLLLELYSHPTQSTLFLHSDTHASKDTTPDSFVNFPLLPSAVRQHPIPTASIMWR